MPSDKDCRSILASAKGSEDPGDVGMNGDADGCVSRYHLSRGSCSISRRVGEIGSFIMSSSLFEEDDNDDDSG